MKKQSLFILLIFSSFFSNSQTDFSVNFPHIQNNFFENKWLAAYAKDKTNKSISITIFDKKNIYHCLIDSGYAVKKWFEQRHEYGIDIFVDIDKEPIASNLVRNKAWYLLNAAMSNAVILYEVDYSEKKFGVIEKIAFSKSESFLGAFSKNNTFYIFAIRPKTKTLKIYTKNIALPISVKEFTLTTPTTFPLSPSFSKEIEKSDLINLNGKYSTAEAGKKLKFYLHKDSIKCTYDDELGRTALFNLNSISNSPDVFLIPHDVMGCSTTDPGQFTFNSFIFENKLYQVNTCSERISVSIKSIPDGALIKEFHFTNSKELEGANSTIIQEGSNFTQSSTDIKHIKSPKDLIRKMLAGNSMIMINREDSNLMLTIGSYKESTGSGYSGMRSWSMGGPIRTPYGNVSAMPIYVGTGYSKWKYTKTAYFKKILFSNSFESNITAVAQPDVFDMVDDYIEKNKAAVGDSKIILNFDSEQVLLFYNKKKKNYSFITFSQ